MERKRMEWRPGSLLPSALIFAFPISFSSRGLHLSYPPPPPFMRRAVSRFLSALTNTTPTPAAPGVLAATSSSSTAPLSPLSSMRSGLPPRPAATAAPAAPGCRLASLGSALSGRAGAPTPPPPARTFSTPSRSLPAAGPSPRSGPAPPSARRASASNSGQSDAASSSPDLRAVPGVGLKNEILLRGAGIHCLADLAAAFHADAAGGGVPARMVEYLQVKGRGRGAGNDWGGGVGAEGRGPRPIGARRGGRDRLAH